MESGPLHVSQAFSLRPLSPPESPNPTALALPDLDLPSLLSRVGGNRPLGMELLRGFCAEYQGAETQIEQLVSRRSYEEGRNFLHGIKGTAANLGLLGVFHSAADYERALKLYPGYHPELQRAFEERLACAFEAIRRVVGDCAGELSHVPHTAPPPGEWLAPMIDEARQHLRQGNVRGGDLVRQVIAQVRWAAPELCAELDRHVANYDFSEAAGVLDQLAERIGFPRE